MDTAKLGQINVNEFPSFGSRNVDCFEKLEQIGEGTHGRVYMAKEIKTGEIVALKEIQMDKKKEDGGFSITAIREIKALDKLHHENVIKPKEVVTSSGPEKDEHGRTGSIYMVLEYMDHDLRGLCQLPGIRINVPQIKCYMRQLLRGLHYCHENQFLHRDIKASILLINNEGILKLADLQLARSLSDDQNENLSNRVITLWYRPPELLLGTTKYGPTVHMWSAGCIFAVLFHREAILLGNNVPEQLNKIFELCGAPDEVNWPGVSKTPWYNRFRPTKPMKSRLSDVFWYIKPDGLELLEAMLTLDPAQRITARDALDDEYFRKYPLPSDPKKYESSHEFKRNKKRRQQQQNEEMAKRQKSQHL